MVYGGGMDGQTDGRTEGRTEGRKDGRLKIPPCVLQDIGPLGPLPKKLKQVAQGQYVVSDTRYPALHGCKLE